MTKKIVWALAGALTLGCSNSKTAVTIPASMDLAPKPAQEDSLTAKLDRYVGQTKFLNLEYDMRRQAEARSGLESAQDKSLGGGRAEQESDVFKVGTAGSKLLYLLNPSRGLQVVSFANGALAPKLVGRVNPTGNYAETMYSDNERGRMISVENYYRDGVSGSRLVVYDVKNPVRPALKEAVDVDGRVVDSRIVGDVLYVAVHNTETRQSRWGWGSERVSGGRVISYNLKSETLTEVQSVDLQLPTAYGELMNIQTSGSGKDMKYYLIAVQSESGWLWWDRASAVEIVDITDPHGKISPLMTVYAKGRITERSQTKIHNGHLIVTSNYTVNTDARENRIARISVEAFKLSDDKAEVLTTEEAEYRRLHIERAVSKAKDSDKEGVREQMLADKELGLKGRFVRQKNNSLKKLVADATVTSGDTTGLSASLQDVRYQGDLLYAFWVPANNVDPLDVFNLSDLEKGVKYEGRLQFDGWISRAFPVTYKNRRFIVGLGWEIQNVNNEDRRRYPQARIFEVKDITRKVRDAKTGAVHQVPALDIVAVPGASVAMNEASHVWANFNGNDREIELRMDNESTGEILFSAYKWSRDGGSLEGGQLIRFNLEDAAEGIQGAAITVGPFLSAPHGWLRRTFNNSEIRMINAFSSQSLSTFDTASLKASETAQALSVLELARDISDYRTLPVAGSTLGLQIIRTNSYSADAGTVLRVVDAKSADAEKEAVKSTLTLPGSAVETVEVSNGSALLVLTSRTDYNAEFYPTIYTLARVQAAADGSLVSDQKSWTEVRQPNTRRGFWSRGSSTALVRTGDGRVLVKTGERMQVVDENKALAPAAVTLSACPTSEQGQSVEVKNLAGHMVVISSRNMSDENSSGVVARYLSLAELNGSELKCGTAVNIPGNPVMMTGKYVVTADRYAKDAHIVTEAYKDHEGKPRESKNLTSIAMESYTLVELGTVEAKLLDQTAELNGRYGLLSATQVAEEDSLLLTGYSNEESRYESSRLHELRVENRRLAVSSYQLDGAKGSVSLLGAVKLPKSGERVLVTTAQDGVRVYRMPLNKRPVTALFKPVLEDGTTGASVENYMSSAYGSVHYTPELNSVEIPSGLRGVVQLMLQ